MFYQIFLRNRVRKRLILRLTKQIQGTIIPMLQGNQ